MSDFVSVTIDDSQLQVTLQRLEHAGVDLSPAMRKIAGALEKVTEDNRINPEDIGSVDVAMDEHDLEYPIDYREDAESAFPLQARATNTVVEGIRLRHEVMVADMVQNPANYAVGNKIALSGASRFTDATSDPEGVISDGKAAVRAKIVKEPNTMVIGYPHRGRKDRVDP